MLPQFTIRQDRVAKTTESWRQWAEEREVDEWIQHCAAVLDQGWNDACVPETKQNEFIILTPFLVPLSPVLHDHTSFRRVSTLTLASNDSRLESSSSGTRRPSLYAVSLGAICLQLMACFQASNPNLPKNIPALITESLRACDAELRQVLMGNVVLTGGGSQFSGFADRLSNELTRTFPHVSGRFSSGNG